MDIKIATLIVTSLTFLMLLATLSYTLGYNHGLDTSDEINKEVCETVYGG